MLPLVLALVVIRLLSPVRRSIPVKSQVANPYTLRPSSSIRVAPLMLHFAITMRQSQTRRRSLQPLLVVSLSIESGGVRVAIASSRTMAPVVWQEKGTVRPSVRQLSVVFQALRGIIQPLEVALSLYHLLSNFYLQLFYSQLSGFCIEEVQASYSSKAFMSLSAIASS